MVVIFADTGVQEWAHFCERGHYPNENYHMLNSYYCCYHSIASRIPPGRVKKAEDSDHIAHDGRKSLEAYGHMTEAAQAKIAGTRPNDGRSPRIATT